MITQANSSRNDTVIPVILVGIFWLILLRMISARLVSTYRSGQFLTTVAGSSKQTFLSSKLTFLSSKLTFLRGQVNPKVQAEIPSQTLDEGSASEGEGEERFPYI